MHLQIRIEDMHRGSYLYVPKKTIPCIEKHSWKINWKKNF